MLDLVRFLKDGKGRINLKISQLGIENLNIDRFEDSAFFNPLVLNLINQPGN